MTTRIDSLQLTNFRAFAEISLAFHPELTVLVAPNGCGKTAILEALVVVWRLFVDGLEAKAESSGFSLDDIRLVIGPERTMEPVLPTKLLATGVVAGIPGKWERRLSATGGKAKTTWKESEQLKKVARSLRQQVIDYSEGKRTDAPILPVLCYYGTGRLWDTHKRAPVEKTEHPDTSRFSGYTDCLSPASSFRFFESWFRRFAYEAQSELGSHRPSPHRPRERLAAVSTAVAKLLRPSGWQQLEWDFAADTLVASHADDGRLPVRLLSDGVRNMIGLVADLAHRCVRLNPHLGAKAPSMTPGIVLIDEVDMHLHPGWQQTVVASLRDAFPMVQFIVTTHSHLVVSTVPSDCVRILASDGSVSRPSLETQGYDSPFALGVVFGVDSKPPVEIAQRLSDYRALLEQGRGDSDDAKALRKRLVEHFGAQHPAMLAADGIRRLQEFKARMAATRGGG